MISIKPVLRWLPPVALGFACVSAAAQTPRLGVSMDETILELAEGFEFQVAGQHIDEPPYDVTVVVAGVDVTSVVTIAPTFEMEDDVDHDGVLEDYTGEFSVSWNELDPVVGDLVTVTVTAPHPGGSARNSDAARVESHVEVILGSPEAGTGKIVDVAVKIDEAEILSQSVRVELDGVDVTSQVQISGPQIADDVPSDEDPSVTHDRFEGFVLDFQTTELHADDRLRVTVEVTTPLGSTASSSVVPIAAAADLTPAQQAAIDTFVVKLKIMEDPNHPGTLCLGADANEIEAAADELQDAVGEDFPAGQKTVDSNGHSVTIKIGTGGGGTVSASGGSATDVTVAIGGDGTGVSNGQNAKATSSGAGKIAIAVGGDASHNGKKGGSGDASSAGANSGTAAGIGGNGTSGAQGGHGSPQVGEEEGKTIEDDGKGGYQITGKDDAAGNLGSEGGG